MPNSEYIYRVYELQRLLHMFANLQSSFITYLTNGGCERVCLDLWVRAVFNMWVVVKTLCPFD